MPDIFQKPYSKTLTDDIAPASKYKYSRSFFLEDKEGNLFRLDEFDISDSTFGHFLNLFVFEIDDWVKEHILEELDRDAECIESSRDLLDYLQNTLLNEALRSVHIGRFVYSDMVIHRNEEAVIGKQIKGAYINPEYSKAGLGLEVYAKILDNHGCLVSDNRQSFAGCSFWAERLSMEFDVYVYDIEQKKVLEKFESRDNGYICSSTPWGISELNFDGISRIREMKLPASLDKRAHIVLFTEG